MTCFSELAREAGINTTLELTHFVTSLSKKRPFDIIFHNLLGGGGIWGPGGITEASQSDLGLAIASGVF